ncbi:hypothetical protein ACWDY7_33525 [Streptomyces calvus]|uniref:Uncharacterized protein n=1 Tax=Streptomyces calvus TaxID=67282 RepID=A0AA40SHF0_9ACTN|nr:hypothetical protein [Streptomyces calvus]MBA8946343.1 hypothetical protein [Streptomyces calvus]
MLLVLVPGRRLLGRAFGSDGLPSAVVAQVRVGLARGVPPGELDGLPPFVGEAGAAADAHGTAGFPLCGNAALPLAGGVIGLPAGFAARLADRLREGLVVRPAETPEDRPSRAVLLQLLLPVTTMGSLPSCMWKRGERCPASTAG